MATLEFGNSNNIKTADDYANEIYALIGEQFPLTLVVTDGNLKQVKCETSWKEGGSISIESTNDDGELVVDYEDDYEEKSLSQAKINKLNTYMQENIVE